MIWAAGAMASRAVFTHLDVRRFQVAMNDALLVRSFQRLGDLLGDGQGFINRQRSLREAIGESRSLDQFHHQSADGRLP